MVHYFMSTYAMEILTALLCAGLGCLGYGAKRLYARFVDDETKQAVARVAVAFVEQVWTAIHGPEKLKKALETAEALLKKKGVAFDAAEMEILIEAAVGEFNRAAGAKGALE